MAQETGKFIDLIFMTNPSIKNSRIKLLAVIGLFILPLIFAFIWYYGLGAAWVAGGATNHAPLIQPIVPLQAFANPKLDNTEINLESLQRRWTIVHRLGNQCQQSCQKSLYNTRQTRKALGRNSIRVQRIVVGSDITILEQVKTDHADVVQILRAPDGLDAQLVQIVTDYGFYPG